MYASNTSQRTGLRRATLRHALGIACTLVILWLILSGTGAPLLLLLGAASALLVSWLTLRMELLDPEEHPFHLRVRALGGYLAWLAGQMVYSNLVVARVVLSPQMPLHPRVLRVRCEPGGMGKVIQANSITLTPGTVTIDIDGPWLYVHCLGRQEGLEAVAERVLRLEAGR